MKKPLYSLAVAALAAACGGGGDVNIRPPVNAASAGGGAGACSAMPAGSASRLVGGQTLHGCPDQATGGIRYAKVFADIGNPITENLTLQALPDGAPHIFEGSLFIGEAHSDCFEAGSACPAQGGDGPILTIEAGAVLAFQSSSEFLVINRGSQLRAQGTAAAPITLTSLSDVNGEAGAEAVQQWGGLVINGFGVTNKCAYTGVRGQPDFALLGGCNVESEGSAGDSANWYGGANDGDSSGTLEYVVVKHTGAEVVQGNELNGVTFGAVGSGTLVRSLQVYSTYDDGVELFGGAVDITNLVAVYVRDDAIDLDEGYIGSIANALVIQQADDGNHCLEADGIGSFADKQGDIADFKARGLHSQPTISQLTCIISPNSETTGTHDTGAGWRFREGIEPTVTNSMVIATYGTDASPGDSERNYCLRLGDLESTDALTLTNNIFACEDRARGAAADGTAAAAWATANGSQFAAMLNAAGTTDPRTLTDTPLVLLQGMPPIYSTPFAQMMVDDSAPTISPGADGHIGAVLEASDWLTPDGNTWPYGIFQGARAQPLWFE